MIHIGAGDLGIESEPDLLRTALALSCATGTAFRWEAYRRKRSGFARGEVEAIRLFADLCGARVDGGELGDDTLELEPGPLSAREYRFEVTAEEPLAPLLRMALVPLARAGGEPMVTLTGSTHAPGGETFEVIDSTFRYWLQDLGIDVRFSLDCAGFVPRGGGEVSARVGETAWTSVTLVERKPLDSIQIVSAGASLPAHVQQRQAARARSGVHISGLEPTVQLLKIRARSAGSVVAITGNFGELPITFASVSERGKSAESVGERAAAAFRQYANQPAVVPGQLVSSLLPFLAFAEGESRITTPSLPATAAGQALLIRAFTSSHVDIEGRAGKPALVRVARAGLQT